MVNVDRANTGFNPGRCYGYENENGHWTPLEKLTGREMGFVIPCGNHLLRVSEYPHRGSYHDPTCPWVNVNCGCCPDCGFDYDPDSRRLHLYPP
jgi:hypothetical protein